MPTSTNDTDTSQDTSDDPQQRDETPSTQIGILEAKQTVLDVAPDLLDHPLEGIIKINQTKDGNWRVVLEVVEREAVPDTQDMIGRYEFTIEPSGTLAGYNLVERYHRGDSKDEL